MRSTRLLWQNLTRVTLFTRENCSLCTTAKTVLQEVQRSRPFDYDEKDVMEESNKQWKDVYEFDTPVIHVEKTGSKEVVAAENKLMHRFTPEQLHSLIASVESK